MTGGSGSYSTSMSSSASHATYGLSATTPATSWPWNRTLSVASTACVSPDRVGIQARPWAASASPVTTATTPGSCSAADASMFTMRACGSGLRRSARCSIPGSEMSSMYCPPPWMKRSSSLRFTLWPTPPISAVVGPGACSSVVVIVSPSLRSVARGARRASRAGSLPFLRCPLDRLDDVHVAGAAAEVAGELPADVVLARVGVAIEQRLAHEHHRRRAEPALQPVHLLEALLDRVELAVLLEALDGGDAPPVRLDREQGARLHRRAVEED